MKRFDKPGILRRNPENLLEEWKRFYTELKNFMITTTYIEKTDEVKIAILKNLIGPFGNEILEKITKNEDTNEKYNVILMKLDEYFNRNFENTNFKIGSLKKSINEIENYQRRKKSVWIENLKIENKNVNFKIDTGSEVNVLPKHVFDSLKSNANVQHSSIILDCFGGFKLKTLGKVNLIIENGRDTLMQEFLLVQDSGTQPIIGLETTERLGFINKKMVCNIENQEKDLFFEKNSKIFTGLGCFPKECELKLKSDAIPVIRPARRIPIKIREKFKDTLKALEERKVISKVHEPVEWINNLVIVEKPNKDLRLCLDPQQLNASLKQEYFHIPNIEDITHDLHGMKYFTVLDLKDGFWQIKLTKESSKLCCFNTIFGVYKFNRLPFGLNVAPQLFQKMNSENFAHIPGVHIYIDDLLIAAKSEKEHDEILNAVMKRADELNIRFNPNKVQYKQSNVKYLGHIFDKDGVRPDSERIKAIQNIKLPKTRKELEKFLGMVNYLRNFIPNMSEITAPLRILMKKNSEFVWNDTHTKHFIEIKNKLSAAPVLAMFDESKNLVIQTDSSQHSIGSCLLQDGRPICFASKSLTDTEQRYAQIEKELLAIVFACKKFHHYIYGRKIKIQTDHLPLIPLMKKDIINSLSSRIQRMRLKLLIYDLDLRHVPGKEMYVADFLSRFVKNDVIVEEEEDLREIIHTINVSDERIDEFKEETKKDAILSKLKEFYFNGWPKRENLNDELRHFEKLKNQLYCENELIFFDNRLCVPTSMRKFMLERLHEGHFGINRTRLRAKSLCYWPKINEDIENFISRCSTCEQYGSSKPKEPIIQHEIPEIPFSKIGCDICEFRGNSYLIIVDYLSKWIEIIQMKCKTSGEIIDKFKQVFSMHGIPSTMIADNMPFNSYEMKKFAKEWNFEIITSSPHYPQSNGAAERAVQTSKNILLKNDGDFHSALLEYRNTPIPGIGISPAEILMGRRMRTKIPIKNELLIPKTHSNIKALFREKNEKSRFYYNKNACIRDEFNENENIMYQRDKKDWRPATIVRKGPEPRSYIIKTANGQILRRNSKFLKKSSNQNNVENEIMHRENNHEVERDTRTLRSGRISKPVIRYGCMT